MAYTWGGNRRNGHGGAGGNGRTGEERAAEVEALTEQLYGKVLELTSSPAWLRMLAVAGRTPIHSPALERSHRCRMPMAGAA